MNPSSDSIIFSALTIYTCESVGFEIIVYTFSILFKIILYENIKYCCQFYFAWWDTNR